MANKPRVKTFERQSDSRRGIKDSQGRVAVRISLLRPDGKRTVGNMTRSVTIRKATVSEIAEVIEYALFGVE